MLLNCPVSDVPYSTVTDLARFRGKSTCKKKKTQQFLRDYTDIGGGVNGYKQIIFDYKKQKTCSLTIFTIDYKELD